MTKHWLETSRPSSAALGPIHTNPGIFETASLFLARISLFVHTKPVNPPTETTSCSVKTLARLVYATPFTRIRVRKDAVLKMSGFV